MELIKFDTYKAYENIEYFSQAIEHNPHYGDAYRERGLAYEISSNTTKAMSDYNKAVEIVPPPSLYYKADLH